MADMIRNRDYITQIKDFSKLRIGTITPTDIDGLIEYKNRAFILFELKHGRGTVRGGQRLALERVIDALAISRPAVCFVCNHTCSGDIDVARVTVCEFRYQSKWWPGQNISLTEYVHRFLNKIQGVYR